MKKIFFLLWIFILLPFFSKSQGFYSKNLEQCSDPKFEDHCGEMLPPTEDYIYLSSRDYASDENINIEYAVTLKRNILYVFNICEGSGKNSMVLNLWDSDNKQVASSINKKTKNNDRIIFFRPTVAGKYYISTFFDKKEENCCLIIFGMIKKNIDKYVIGKYLNDM